MIVIPAIDLKDGRCVRLKQGLMSHETVYSASPQNIALSFVQKGAERIHIVDLNGAVSGRPQHMEIIKGLAKTFEVPIQVGGGIRTMSTIEGYIASGVEWVILGTSAFRHPEFLFMAVREFPGHIMIGIDAKKGQVAIEGWTIGSDCSAVQLAKRYEGEGVSALIYTDIHRDGMGTGPNIDETKELAQAVKIPVIASGGISNLDDVRRVATLSDYGVIGMITGRAIYEGTLHLEEAIGIAQRKMEHGG
jgi:phosphoribosylformimino-5-aminoimidazole carboxamide ribotide isomerase